MSQWQRIGAGGVVLLLGFAAVACAPEGLPMRGDEEVDANEEGVTGSLAVGTKLTATGNVNLRSGPSTSTKVLGVVPKGASVTVVGAEPNGGFYDIDYLGKVGWSSGKYYEKAAQGPSDPTAGIWSPAPGTSWQWQLTGTVDASYSGQMFDIDLFDAPDSAIAKLHAEGRAVICYFSAGSREDWRPDAGDFDDADLGDPLDGWPGERWLDPRSANVRKIMIARLDRAVARGCTGVEPDNVDAYANESGFPLTAAHQLAYSEILASEAHARGLSVGLKNALDLVPKLVAHFDWALDEECFAYHECEDLHPFIAAGKAVFHVEYVTSTAKAAAKKAAICGDPSVTGFSTLIKKLDLGAWRATCD